MCLEHTGKVRLVDLDPARPLALLGGLERGRHERKLAALLVDLGRVVRRDLVARDVHALAVDENVSVTDELASLSAALRKTDAQHDVVEPLLDQTQHLFAGASLHAGRLAVVTAELRLEQAVDAAHLLLLAQPEA